MKLKGDWHPLNHCGICQRKIRIGVCQHKIKIGICQHKIKIKSISAKSTLSAQSQICQHKLKAHSHTSQRDFLPGLVGSCCSVQG